MRIAQIVFAKVYSADWEEVTQLPKSVRAEGGFGSSGL
jgi:dUTPase